MIHVAINRVWWRETMTRSTLPCPALDILIEAEETYDWCLRTKRSNARNGTFGLRVVLSGPYSPWQSMVAVDAQTRAVARELLSRSAYETACAIQGEAYDESVPLCMYVDPIIQDMPIAWTGHYWDKGETDFAKQLRRCGWEEQK